MGCAVNCAEVDELAGDYAANRLIWIERWRYRAHLATCPVCRRLARQGGSAGQVVTPGVPGTLTPRVFMMVSLWDKGIAAVGRFPLSWIQLAMRVAIGGVFFNAGLMKYRSWELTLLLFRDEYKVPLMDPALSARMATFNELTFSTLIVLGLATRMATLPFLGMLVVIQTFVYPQAWVEHLTWASILLFLLTRGPGAISLDRLIWRRWHATASSHS